MHGDVSQFDCIAALKALGEENRIRIVRLLIERRHGVNEIAESVGITQYNVSKHLRILKEAGLLEVEKHGQQRLYALAAEFRGQLEKTPHVLDLGCCTFHFDKQGLSAS